MDRSIRWSRCCSRRMLAVVLGVASALSFASAQAQEACGTNTYPFPYTDVAGVGDPFCPGIMEAYVTGVTKGTTPTTFSPNANVIRLEMSTFLQRSLDQSLTRSARRAALNQWWIPQNTSSMQPIAVGGSPYYCTADGQYIWLANSGQLVQVDVAGNVQTWTGAAGSIATIVAAGNVYAVGNTAPGSLYVINRTQPPGPVTVASSTLGNNPQSIAFDGTNLWTANALGPSVSIITPQSPYTVTTVTTGFGEPYGILYDGTNIWVTDYTANTLLRLDNTGTIIQTVPVGLGPGLPVFDGTNIWVPNYLGNSITVVQASSGNVVATIIEDGNNLLIGPNGASFDGERVLVANYTGNTVTLFKAVDLSFIANVSTQAGSTPNTACSDGIDFWVPLLNASQLLRF